MRTFGAAHQTLVATRLHLAEATREVGLLLAFVGLFPIGILFFLHLVAPPQDRVQLLVGTILMEMALLNINVLAQSIGGDKRTKIWDLWVSLPISPVVYVLSVSLSFLPYSLASAAVILAVAIAAFGLAIPASAIPLLVAGFVLVWASTLGVGFLVGVYGRSPRQINTYSQLIGIILTFFAPVFYPASLLPLPLRLLSYVWPLTWGAQLLVALVHGAAASAALSASVLGGFIALWFVLIGLGLRWRQP